MSDLLRVEGLTVAFGPQTVLDDIDLEVPTGGLAALLGPSGSGKSTLLRVVAGLQEPRSGTVTIGHLDCSGVPAHRRGAVLLSQQAALLPHRTLRDNVSLAARLQGVDRAAARREAMRWLELVRIADLADRLPSQVSGGQEQRAALARALAAGPRVLLLDEPFSALDGDNRRAMHDLVRELRLSAGPTIVLVTHDVDEAAALADTLHVLHGGRIVREGLPQDVLRRPGHEAVARMVGVRTLIPGLVESGVFSCAAGSLELPAGEPVRSGEALLALRPEITMIVAPCDPAALLAGMVTAVLAAGVRYEMHVDTAAGTVIVESVHPATVGARVGIAVDPADRHVIAIGFGDARVGSRALP